MEMHLLSHLNCSGVKLVGVFKFSSSKDLSLSWRKKTLGTAVPHYGLWDTHAACDHSKRVRKTKQELAQSEIQHKTASCQMIILVLHLFASAKFQGHPSEKLAEKKSCYKGAFCGGSFSLEELCFETMWPFFNRRKKSGFYNKQFLCLACYYYIMFYKALPFRITSSQYVPMSWFERED